MTISSQGWPLCLSSKHADFHFSWCTELQLLVEKSAEALCSLFKVECFLPSLKKTLIVGILCHPVTFPGR